MAFKPATFKPATTNKTVISDVQQVTPDIQNSESNAPVTIIQPQTSSLTIPTNDLIKQTVTAIVSEHQKSLVECGLSTNDVITSTTEQLISEDVFGISNITDLGGTSALKINQYSDAMLEHVRCRDLEDMGNNLNEVIGIAKGVDIEGLIGKNNIFSKVFSKFKNTKEKILAQFNSVSTQLERVVQEIEKQQDKLKERAKQLDTVFQYNMEEYKSLALSIIYGETKKQILADKLNEMSLLDDTPLMAQQRSDLTDAYNRIDKRILDLKTLQMTALQTAPMIRMVQSNNISLVEKFDNIKMLTIPAWKKQFTLAISMIEQKKSIELANKIDDATNDLIRKNADLLRQNTLNSAQSSQRSTVDIETLQHVQETLIATLQDVVNIEKEGARNRELADQKMIEMKHELSNVLKK